MIEINQLSKRFGAHTVVEDVSLTVGEGETLVLLGTSGSGKTTTLKMINRLIEPTAGRISIGGKNVLDRPAALLRREVGYVIQESGLFPHYTVEENIAVVPKLLQWDARRIVERTRALLAMLRLPEDLLHQYPDQLSGGQRQRVGLARALAADPPIVLMDEPLGALDPVTRAGIRQEFQQLDDLRRKTIVMVTHDTQEAFELGDRIGLMHEGRLQQVGLPIELLQRPANDFVRRFFTDQRFSLQLRAFTLQDLAAYLPASAEVASNRSMVLTDPRTRLSEALERLPDGESLTFVLEGRTFGGNAGVLINAMYTRMKAYG